MRKTQFSNGSQLGFPFARDLRRPTQTQSALCIGYFARVLNRCKVLLYNTHYTHVTTSFIRFIDWDARLWKSRTHTWAIVMSVFIKHTYIWWHDSHVCRLSWMHSWGRWKSLERLEMHECFSSYKYVSWIRGVIHEHVFWWCIYTYICTHRHTSAETHIRKHRISMSSHAQRICCLMKAYLIKKLYKSEIWTFPVYFKQARQDVLR
jgi:hypothetical protein